MNSSGTIGNQNKLFIESKEKEVISIKLKNHHLITIRYKLIEDPMHYDHLWVVNECRRHHYQNQANLTLKLAIHLQFYFLTEVKKRRKNERHKASTNE